MTALSERRNTLTQNQKDDDAQSVRSSTTEFEDPELKDQLNQLLQQIEALSLKNAEKEKFLEKTRLAMQDQYSHLSDPQRDNVILMEGQIQNKKTQLELERAKADEHEEQNQELKQMSVLQDLIQIKIRCD